MDPIDPGTERDPDHEEPDQEILGDAELEAEPERRAVPNPSITAGGVIAAILVIFALSSVPFVARLVIAFAIVAAAAYLSVMLAHRR